MLPGDEHRRLREWRELIASAACLVAFVLVVAIATLWP